MISRTITFWSCTTRPKSTTTTKEKSPAHGALVRNLVLRSTVAHSNFTTGKIYRSMTGIYILDGKRIRTPGGYRCVEPETGRSTGVPLRETHEYIHPSTRSRKVLRGPGISDDGRYDCHPLDPYKLRTKETADRRASAFWQLRRQYRGTRQKELPESPLWGIEKELLAESPRMYDYLLSVSEDDESISPPESRELRPRARG